MPRSKHSLSSGRLAERVHDGFTVLLANPAKITYSKDVRIKEAGTIVEWTWSIPQITWSWLMLLADGMLSCNRAGWKGVRVLVTWHTSWQQHGILVWTRYSL